MNGHEEKARVQWRVCRSVEGRIHTWDVRFPGRERWRSGLTTSAIVLNVKVGDRDIELLTMRFDEAIPISEMTGTWQVVAEASRSWWQCPAAEVVAGSRPGVAGRPEILEMLWTEACPVTVDCTLGYIQLVVLILKVYRSLTSSLHAQTTRSVE